MTLPSPDRDVKDDVIEKMCATFDDKDRHNEVGDEPFRQWPESWKEPLRKQMRAAVRVLADWIETEYKPPLKPRPTVEELEAILNTPEPRGISILPDGSITVENPLAAALRAIAGPET